MPKGSAWLEMTSNGKIDIPTQVIVLTLGLKQIQTSTADRDINIQKKRF